MRMPVMVVGADTSIGEAIVAALQARHGEIRSFVTDPVAGAALRERGIKVAIGDLSDGSHLGAAAYDAFTSVLVEAAAHDGRRFTFAADAGEVLAAWVSGLRAAGVQRAIWVGDPPRGLVEKSAPETRVIAPAGRSDHEIAQVVADLNDLETLN